MIIKRRYIQLRKITMTTVRSFKLFAKYGKGRSVGAPWWQWDGGIEIRGDWLLVKAGYV